MRKNVVNEGLVQKKIQIIKSIHYTRAIAYQTQIDRYQRPSLTTC